MEERVKRNPLAVAAANVVVTVPTDPRSLLLPIPMLVRPSRGIVEIVRKRSVRLSRTLPETRSTYAEWTGRKSGCTSPKSMATTFIATGVTNVVQEERGACLEKTGTQILETALRRFLTSLPASLPRVLHERDKDARVRVVLKYRHCDGNLCIKVTDNAVCLQYKTDQAQDVKKIEKLHGKLMRLMVSKETHSGSMETD
ncbi:hypothetical protein F2P81_023724 [Scophthalmus maximus]|uniref:Signal recognition particle 9 kDa protein n=1 Tax=Scophthalmus maximus TaxID=52904 RepID=A0A6A4RXA6_SCOMX|nr:hypothetical protein F2P81_023724 [Scophthalmus maximus]